jgi:hypothetical protein
MSRPMPPSGANAPLQTRTAAGDAIDLVALAQDVCRRYSSEFPDEQERYGAAGHAWCLHDNQYLLAWAIQDARDHTVELAEQVAWLADVLDSTRLPDRPPGPQPRDRRRPRERGHRRWTTGAPRRGQAHRRRHRPPAPSMAGGAK